MNRLSSKHNTQWHSDELEMPSWTSIHVSDSEDGNSVGDWNDNELKLDEIMNIDDTGNFFIEKPLPVSSPSQSNAHVIVPPTDTHILQQNMGSSAPDPRLDDHPAPNQPPTDQTETVAPVVIAVPNPARDLSNSFNASSPSRSRSPPGEVGVNASAISSTSSTEKRLNVDTQALDLHSVDTQESGSRRFIKESSGAVRSGEDQNTRIGPDSTPRAGSTGEGLGERSGMTSSAVGEPRRVLEASKGSGGLGSASTAVSRLLPYSKSAPKSGHGTSVSTATISSPASAKTKKNIQTSLSAYGFQSSASSASSSIITKPKANTKAKFLGVFVSPIPTPSKSSQFLSSAKSHPKRSHKTFTSPSSSDDETNDAIHIVDALTAAFSSNDRSDYALDKSSVSSLLPSSSSVSDHSHTPSTSAPPSPSTTPVSNTFIVHAHPSNDSAHLATKTKSATSSFVKSRTTQSTARPSHLGPRSKLKSTANKSASIRNTTANDSRHDHDDINLDIQQNQRPDAPLPHTSLEYKDRNDSGSALDRSSSPDPLGLRTPSNADNDDSSGNRTEGKVEGMGVVRDHETPHAARKRKYERLQSDVQDFEEVGNSNSIVNALSSAFGHPIGTPVRSRVLGAGAAVIDDDSRVVRDKRTSATFVPSPLAPLSRRKRMEDNAVGPSAFVSDTTTPEDATEERPTTFTLADALSRAFANNDNNVASNQGRILPIRIPAQLSPSRPLKKPQQEGSDLRVVIRIPKMNRDRGDADVTRVSTMMTQEEVNEYLEVMVADVPTLGDLEVMELKNYEDEEEDQDQDEGQDVGEKDKSVMEGVDERKTRTQESLDAVGSVSVVVDASVVVDEGQDVGEKDKTVMEGENGRITRTQESLDAVGSVSVVVDASVVVEERPADEMSVEEIETDGVIQARQEKAREMEERRSRKRAEKEEEERKKWQQERFCLEMNVAHIGGGKFVKLVRAETELEKLRRGYSSELGHPLLQGKDIEDAITEITQTLSKTEKDAITQPTESEEEREWNRRKAEAQYLHDGRSYTEQFLQRINEWFGPEFLTVKALGTGQKPKKARVPQIPSESLLSAKGGLFRNDETSDEETEATTEVEVAVVDGSETLRDRTPPSATPVVEPESQTSIETAFGASINLDHAIKDGHHVEGEHGEERARLSMKRARDEMEMESESGDIVVGIAGPEVNGNGTEDGAVKRARIDVINPDDGNNGLAAEDFVVCPALLQKLVKGKSKVSSQEMKMIGRFLEVLAVADDDWSMIPQASLARVYTWVPI
ncbi:hypothetical protein K435DRAFT_864779 [Dendrothele bispora CBS 962.96]|uniref:Uncharacterized protein n=1 Tax=Dendrothele bispora (strain CBS 962.96) TaxID=1314807 RepID=A0A4S8LMM4_DENBC|nr:hypothetical protein K435DRAFT_864779 [Dendrothele bispora CBS 962.96]